MIWEKEISNSPFSESRVWKIVSSAGCGKTYTIENTIMALIDGGVNPIDIMYLVFNNKPGREFRERILGKGIPLGQLRWIGTHHSIYLKMLGLTGKNILDVKKWGVENGMVFPREREGWSEVLSDLEKKLYENKTDFDPLEEGLLALLEREEVSNKKWTHARYAQHALSLRRMPSNIQYVFVDEAQDGVPIQWDYYEHIRSLDHIKGLMLVGDDKQAISGWCGGRGDLFLEFKADRQVCLSKTYRNAPAILGAANRIAEMISVRSPLTSESAREEKGIVDSIPYLEGCVEDIRAALKRGQKVMVLCRNTLWAYKAERTMEKMGIPVESAMRSKVLAVNKAMKNIARKELSNIFYGDILSVLGADIVKTKDYIENLARFKKGDFEEIARAEFALMENGLPWSGDLSLFGIKERFMDDMTSDKLPTDIWSGVSTDMISSINTELAYYGEVPPCVICSTIHRVKGMECDMAILIRNITGAVKREERSNPDDEARVWYTGATRAKTHLIYTEIHSANRQVTRLI